MAKIGERLEVTTGPAAQVEDREGRRAFDGLQQCGDVLPHVMIAGAFPERRRPLAVMFQRRARDRGKLWRQ